MWVRTLQYLLQALVIAAFYLVVSFWMDGHPSQALVFRYIDDTATMTVDEVHALDDAAFEEVPAMQSAGHSRAAHWFRLQRPASAGGNRQVLLVQPSYLDDVRFFLPDPGEPARWIESRQGDSRAFAQRPREELGFAVDATVPPGQWMYVRVMSGTGITTHIRLLDELDVVNEDALTLLGVGVYGGGVLLLSFGSALLAVAGRDRLWGLNAVYQLVTAVAVVMYFGLVNRLVWPQQPELANRLTDVISSVHFLCGAVFYRTYVRQHVSAVWPLRLLDLHVCLLVFQLLLVSLGMSHEGFSINIIVVPLSAVIAALMTFDVHSDDAIEEWLLRLNMLGIFAYFTVFFLLARGIMPASFMQLYPGLFVNAVTAVVLQLTLLRRNKLLARQKENAARELELTRQRVASERREREEDGRFLGMLLHEVRSPLTVLAMALGGLKRRLQAMGDVDNAPLRRDLQRIDASISQMRGLFLEVEAFSEIGHHKRQVEGEGEWHDGVQPWVDAQQVMERLVTEFGQADRRVDLDGWRQLRDAGGLRGARMNCGVPLVLLMVRNLVNNALKYSPAGSVVRLRAEVCPGSQPGLQELRLGVVNSVGEAGFPDTGRLFKKYYRAQGAQGLSGTGLGLYWVRGIAQILHGDITYHAEGGDICFSLVMPLHAATAYGLEPVTGNNEFA